MCIVHPSIQAPGSWSRLMLDLDDPDMLDLDDPDMLDLDDPNLRYPDTNLRNP